MTDKQQPEALRLAVLLELAPEYGVEPQTTEDAAAELRRLHTENTMLQQGYAAARLEIESLQARIKTMAEEHADELMVAHLDGMRGRSTEPAGEYPAPTDAEIVELMRDGYNCRYNDEADHIDFASAVLAKWGAQPVASEPLTDAQIDAVAESMPGGLAGFLKGWGWRQFAREILTLRRMPDWEPQFDCMTPKQEELAIQFCQEIAGPRGERGSPPDPVRLLEMAEALYKAEREHHHGIKGGQHGTE